MSSPRSRVAAGIVATVVTSGLLAAVPAASAGAAAFGCTSDYYLTGTNVVVQVPPGGGSTTIATPGVDPLSIAMNTAGELYALPDDTATGNHLVRVESDGTSTDLGAIAGLPADTYVMMTFASDDVLWIAKSTTLYAIDVATVAVASTVTASAAPQAGIAEIDGVIYSMAGGFTPSLARIDLATGTRTTAVVSGLTATGSIWGMDGHLYVTQNDGIVEIVGYETASPQRVLLGAPVGVPDDAAACPAAPSPFLSATDDDLTSTPLIAGLGGATASVLGNDLRAGSAVAPAGVTATLTDDGGLVGATLASDGTIAVPTDAEAGDYSLAYRICATDTPLLCDPATVRLTIAAAPTDGPSDDDPSGDEPPGPELAATGAEPMVGVGAGLLGLGALVMLAVWSRRRPLGADGGH